MKSGQHSGLVVTVREAIGFIEDPHYGLGSNDALRYEWVLAVHPEGSDPIYRVGYSPSEDDVRRRLDLSMKAAERFVAYYRYFNTTEQRLGTTDCFALAAHLSSGTALASLEGERLQYRLKGRVSRANRAGLMPGSVYVCADPDTAKPKHAMIGLGGEEVLSQLGRHQSIIGVSAVHAVMGVYGGSLYRIKGSIDRC